MNELERAAGRERRRREDRGEDRANRSCRGARQVSAENDPTVWKIIGGFCLAVVGFFGKQLHGKIDKAASKEELTKAITAIGEQRTRQRWTRGWREW